MTRNELLKKQDKQKLRKRIMHKVQKAEDGCWEWTGWKIEGYAMMNLTSGKTSHSFPVSRVIWFLEGRRIPRYHRLGHSCGNTACVNPEHLWLERNSGGPRKWKPPVHGAEHHNARLDETKVRKMRRLRKEERLTYVEIAEKFDIDPNTARRACIGQTWSHVK